MATTCADTLGTRGPGKALLGAVFDGALDAMLLADNQGVLLLRKVRQMLDSPVVQR